MRGDTDLEVRGAPGAPDRPIVFRFGDRCSAAGFRDVLRQAWPEASFRLRPSLEADPAAADGQPQRTGHALRR